MSRDLVNLCLFRYPYAEGQAAVEEAEPEGGGGHGGFSCDDRGMAVQAGGGQDIMAKTMVPRCAHAHRGSALPL